MRRVLSLVLLVVASLSALMASAARSDFAMRGCRDIPRAEWPDTANCSDGWLAMVLFGGGAAVLAGAALWVLWRLDA